jgi:probable phosphoglycerate mutase
MGITTTFGFIRHGITAWNAEGRLQGQIDIELSPEGSRQAMALADRLAAEKQKWDLIYSSDLSRAEQTARYIADKIGGTNVITDVRLRERSFGLLEGTTVEERISRWGEQWAELDLGVESDEHLLARGLSFIEEMCEIHPNQNILIVSHGGYLALLYTALFDSDTDEHISNTSFSIAVREKDKWHKRLFNCTAHIQA